jgi:pimeloyl-ACP methyl ester carboxylesterase
MNEEKRVIKGFTCRVISNIQEGTPIIFLHGYSFTSKVWEQVNILKLLEEKGFPFLAIDMPYGLKSECKPKTRSPERNIELIQEAVSTFFQGKKPFIVGASMGGNISLRYSSQHPVGGMLLVAPVRGLTDDLVKGYENLRSPVYIIYGTKDRVVTQVEMERLKESMLNSRLIIYKGANHPAYLDKPDDFKGHLLEAYENKSA